MKTSKLDIINDITARADSDRIISLREVAADHGLNHIAAQDCRDIMAAVIKARPDYRAVKMCTDAQLRNPSTAGLFSTLCSVDRTTEFCGEED